MYEQNQEETPIYERQKIERTRLNYTFFWQQSIFIFCWIAFITIVFEGKGRALKFIKSDYIYYFMILLLLGQVINIVSYFKFIKSIYI